MGYQLFFGEKRLGRDYSAVQVEDIIRRLARFEDEVFLVQTELPSRISAEVLRQNSKETVELESVGIKISVMRHTPTQLGGELCVSCNPQGEKASVESFNLELENVEDGNLDRGLVWVIPGEPAKLMLGIKGWAAKTPGKIKQLLADANQLVESMIINKFADAAMAVAIQ